MFIKKNASTHQLTPLFAALKSESLTKHPQHPQRPGSLWKVATGYRSKPQCKSICIFMKQPVCDNLFRYMCIHAGDNSCTSILGRSVLFCAIKGVNGADPCSTSKGTNPQKTQAPIQKQNGWIFCFDCQKGWDQ